MLDRKFKKVLKIAISSVLIVISIKLIYGAIINNPIADDYFILSAANRSNLFSLLKEHYTTINGRLGFAVVNFSLADIFKDLYTVILPLINISTIFLIAFLLFKKLKSRTNFDFALIYILLISFIVSVPSIFDIIYWTTSASVYLTPILLLTLAVIIKNKLFSLTSFLLAMLFSEPLSLIVFGTLAVIIIINKLIFKLRTAAKYFYFLVISFISLIIMAMSPGSISRRQNYGFDLAHPIYILKLTMTSILQTRISLIISLLIALLIGNMLSSKIKLGETIKKLDSVLILFYSICLFIGIHFLSILGGGLQGDEIEFRISLISNTVLCLSFFVIGAKSKLKLKEYYSISLYLILFSYLVYVFNITNKVITSIDARHSEYIERDQYIDSKQKCCEILYVSPVELKGVLNQASDLVPDDQKHWMNTTFAEYMNIKSIYVIK